MELNPPRKSPDSLQDHAPSSPILLNIQLVSNITGLPGNIAFLWRFCFMYIRYVSYKTCILLLLCCWVPVVLCLCHLWSGKKRELAFQREKMYTVFSVRDWAINLVSKSGGFCLSLNIRKLLKCSCNELHKWCNMGAFLNTDIHLFINVTETG